MGGYSIKDWGAAGASAMALVLAVTVAGNLLVPLPPEPEPGSPDATTASAPAPNPAAKESARPAAQPASSAGPVSLAARLAVADAKRGETVAKKCVACHPLDKDAKAKVGPTLWGVVERKVATGDFKFSEALVKLGGTWTFERLEAYSENPKTFAPGNKMAFGGIANPAERADLLAFLRGRTDAPVPLPQPKPEELAAAKAGAAAAPAAPAAPTAPVVPQELDPDLRGLAGVRPFERPAGVPFVTAVYKSPEWFKTALTGIVEPIPPSLAFLKDQEFWFNPFTRPGMPGKYDIRGWHSSSAKP